MKGLVEPIKNKKDIERVEEYLRLNSKRNQLIWAFGINTGLRISDILDKVPVIMFYPGRYDQKELMLFKGKTFDGLKDDNYYRAFRLVANE